MLRRVACSFVQSRGIKHTVNIKWVRPDYVPAYKPEISGDLEPLPPGITQDAIGTDYALTEELKDAPESVKKIFSVGHLGRKEYNTLVKEHFMARVRRHQYDYSNSAETRIARLTGHIRCLQESMEQCPKNNVTKKAVQELISKRKRYLKFLRQYDYKKFEWLLEQLNIVYKGHPESNHIMSRKESLRKLTEMHCEDIRNKKLEDYKNLLESQQGPYLQNKLETLKFIRSEQKELQLPITVTEQDLKKVEQQLADWTAKDKIKQEAKKKKRSLIVDVN